MEELPVLKPELFTARSCGQGIQNGRSGFIRWGENQHSARIACKSVEVRQHFLLRQMPQNVVAFHSTSNTHTLFASTVGQLLEMAQARLSFLWKCSQRLNKVKLTTRHKLEDPRVHLVVIVWVKRGIP